MTYKEIDASRNIRLWITQVALPVATLTATTLIALPEARRAIGEKIGQISSSIKSSFKKESKSNTKVVLKLDAKNRDEAFSALEVMAKEVFENTQNNVPIKKSVQVKR